LYNILALASSKDYSHKLRSDQNDRCSEFHTQSRMISSMAILWDGSLMF
jgi:hypothetical protein